MLKIDKTKLELIRLEGIRSLIINKISKNELTKILKDDLKIDSKDCFEKDADNIMEVRVRNDLGEDITKNSTVDIFLSQNALYGLGTELIRMAHNFKEGKHVHLEPVTEEALVQRMGVFLTPDSSEVMICCNQGKCIDEYMVDGNED